MAGGYSVTISAVDNATKQIEAVNRRIAAINAPVQRLQRSLTRFGDVTGITKINRGMRDLASRSMGAFQAVGRIVEPLAAITSAASVAGMLRLTSAWAQFGVASANTAMRLGISVDRLQSLQGAAVLTGASSDALTSGLETLGSTLYDAIGGRAPEAVVMLNTLGIAFRDAGGHARSVSDVLPELADRIASMSNPYDQLRAATALLGGSARDLLPFLQKGSAGIAEYNELAQRYGVMNKAGADAARQMQFEQAKLTLATQGLSNSIAQALAPTLGPLMSDLSEWIAANRELIATDVGGFVREIGNDLRGIDWKANWTEIKHLATETNDVVQAFGGWKTVIEGIIALKLLGWVTGLLGPVATLVRLLALIPGSGVAAGAAAVGVGGYLGYRGAVQSGTEIGQAAELGMRPSSLPGSMDEFGNVMLYQGPDGKTHTPDEIRQLYAARHPVAPGGAPGSGAPQPSSGGGLLGWLGHKLGLSASDPGLGNPGPSAADTAGRSQQAVNYFRSQGWSGEQAAALAGGIQGESGFNPQATGDKVNGNPTAFGLGQWHMNRVNSILSGTGIDVRSADYASQLQAMQWELTHTERAAGQALRQTGSIPDGSRVLVSQYERSANQDRDTALRTQYATGLYANYGREDAVPSVPPDPPVNVAGGTGAPPADVTHTVNGQASLTVNLGPGFPSNSTVAAQTSGGLFQGAPKIHRAMADAG